MLVTYQYRVYPTTEQKLRLNKTRRICQYLYNRLLGERFDWWENNRCYVNACPLWSCALPELKDKPDKITQQSLLPFLKQDLVLVDWSGEILDLSTVYSQVLQDVVHRIDKAFKRYIQGDSKGKRSGKPRFKGEARYRSITYNQAKNDWLKGDYINLPKIGLVKVRYHRPIPDGFAVKTCQVIKKADGWYINLALEDKSIPDFTPDEIKPTEDNSIGVDMGLEKFLTASDGEIVPIYQPLRKNQEKLTAISQKKNKRKKGSKSRRKLAKKESKLHQKIARARRDNYFKVANQLVDFELEGID
jgi:putative transposase